MSELFYHKHLSTKRRSTTTFRDIFSGEDDVLSPKITFEGRMFDLLSGLKEKNQRLLGLLLMSGAGLFLTLGNCLVQYVYKKNEKIKISSYEILFVRSVIQAFFTVILMVYGKVHPYGGKKKNLITLFSMGVAEVVAIVFFYLGLERIPVGDATVIQFTAPVFTVLFSFAFLRKGCGWLDTIVGMVSFLGVVFIAKPELLSSPQTHVHVHAHNVKDMFNNHNYMEGALFALLTAVFLSLFFILNKVNGMKLDVTLTIFYPSLFGIIAAPVAMAISKDQFLLSEINTVHWTIIIVVGFVSFIGLLFMGQALQLEDAGPAVLIRNCDVIYAFILQYFLMNHSPSLAALVGTIIVLCCTTIIALNRFFKLEEKCCLRCGCKKCQDHYRDKHDEESQQFMLPKSDNEDDDEEEMVLK